MKKSEEESKEDKKGGSQFNIHPLLVEKLSIMKSVVGLSEDSRDDSLPFSPWNLYFSSLTPAPIEELNVNLSKLIATTNSKGPQYQSLERAEKFFIDLK